VAHAVLLYAMSTGSVSGTATASEQAMTTGSERQGANFRR
jgi:hypothetical protein